MNGKITITARGKGRGTPDFRIISVRVKEDLIDRLDKIAGETNRSRNEVITLLLESAIELVDIRQ